LHPPPHSFPTRRSSDLVFKVRSPSLTTTLFFLCHKLPTTRLASSPWTLRPKASATRSSRRRSILSIGASLMSLARRNPAPLPDRSEEHTSELQSRGHLV